MLLAGTLAAVSNDRHLPASEQGENSNTVKGSCKDCKIRSASHHFASGQTFTHAACLPPPQAQSGGFWEGLIQKVHGKSQEA